MPKPKRTEKSHCNKCGHETKHCVIAERQFKGSELFDQESGITIDWSDTYTMLECLGCESIALKKVAWFSEWEGEEVTYYPPAVSRRLPAWVDKLPSGESELLKEVYTALHANSPNLAIMGTRALLDLMMTREVGDIGGFDQKLLELKAKGIIGEVPAGILNAALEVGHAVIHRGHRAKEHQVSKVFDIVENLLHISILKDDAKALRASTPKRKKRKKRKKASP